MPEEFRPLIEKALQLAQAAGYSGQLNTIEAIKFYRQASGASLAEAKRVIELAGPLHVGPSRGGPGQGPWPAGAPAGGATGLGKILVLLVIGVGAAVAVIAIVAQNNRRPTGSPPPSGSAQTPGPSAQSIASAPLPPSTPQFATMAMEFGSQGTGPGHFEDARSIAVDNHGHIYVGEYSNGRVQVFDTAGKYLSEFSLGAGSRVLNNLMADRSGTVYAVSSSRILRYTGATGAALGEMDNTDGQSQKAYVDACLATGGAMHAISNDFTGAPQIVKFDAGAGKIVSSFDTRKSVGESLDLFRIVAMTTGEIYALDRTHGLFKFAADGRYVNRFGGGASAGASPLNLPPSILSSPQNLATDSQGRIYVSDPGSGIKVYDKDGNYLDKFGGNEAVFGIAIDDEDGIYACMRNRHTVRKYVIARHP